MINLLKFTHLIFALGLVSLAIYCFALIGSKTFAIKNTNKQDRFNRLNQLMLVFCVLAMLTGTFLIYPKHFTFHTPWIQAAYLFTLISGLIVLILMSLKQLRQNRYRVAWRLAYLVLTLILMLLIHDAVTKTAL